jgi:hypothetical protein
VVSFTPGSVNQGKSPPGTHCIRGWVGPTTRVHAVQNINILPLPGILQVYTYESQSSA